MVEWILVIFDVLKEFSLHRPIPVEYEHYGAKNRDLSNGRVRNKMAIFLKIAVIILIKILFLRETMAQTELYMWCLLENNDMCLGAQTLT
jgi:hypothetical protein